MRRSDPAPTPSPVRRPFRAPRRRDRSRSAVGRALAALVALATLVALAPAAPARAVELDGFLPAAGEGAVAPSVTVESYDEFWRGDVKTSAPPVGEVETTSVSLWLTWGFTDRVALVVNGVWTDVDSDGTAGFEDDGLQDVTALVQWLAWRTTTAGGSGDTTHSLILAGGFRSPLSSYEADAPISLGDGTDDALVRAVYQLRVGSFYASQQVGYDLRGGDAPDGWRLHTEAGWSFGRITASGLLSVQLAESGTDIGDPGFTFPSNEEEWVRAGAKVYGSFNERFGATFLAFTTLDGKNTGDATGVSLGLVTKF